MTVSPVETPAHVAVRLDGVSKTYESRDGPTGLATLTVDVAMGEFLCIVGPSGCGKSTALNLVAGILKPDTGRVTFGTERTSRVGYMLARDSLFPWRTARANVELALEMGPSAVARRGERHARADELLDMVGLRASADLYPRQLSQGMRQRVALARTLATDPEMFLMDEPFGALDAQTRRVLQEEFLRVWSVFRKSVMLVTHDLMEAILLGDRILVMNGRPGVVVSEYTVGVPREHRFAAGPFAARLAELHEALWRDLKAQPTRS
jgi:NitT/TauT family transport system ATP-binding protein